MPWNLAQCEEPRYWISPALGRRRGKPPLAYNAHTRTTNTQTQQRPSDRQLPALVTGDLASATTSQRETRENCMEEIMVTAENPFAQPAACKHTGTVGGCLKPRDPRSGLRCYLLLKYLQVLVLPEASELVLLVGALASAHAALLLSSPRISWKASNVLLGQLVLTDMLLPLRWGLEALGVWWGDEVAGALVQGLLGAQRQASSLLLSCLSLEVVLMRWRAEETRRLRTVHHARMLSGTVWALTLGRLLLLQAVGHSPLPVQGPALKVCLLAVSVLRSFTRCLKGALWLADTWVYYTIFCNSTQCRKSCLR